MNEENEQYDKTLKKRKFWAKVKATACALLFVGACSSMYTIKESQQAVITQFGKPKNVIINPLDNENRDSEIKRLMEKYQEKGVGVDVSAGLYFKVPFIDSVNKSDRRLLRWNGYPDEVSPKDKRYIHLDTTARWFINDPLEYYTRVKTETQALGRLDEIIDGIVINSVTLRPLVELVRSSNREMKVSEEELKGELHIEKIKEGREKIVDEIIGNTRKSCYENQLGLTVAEKGILITDAMYVDKVKEKVEERMKSERDRVSAKYRSEGDAKYQEIMGQKERDVKEIMSEAYKKAETIKGEADAKAVKIYADAYNRNPEFYKFYRTLEVYKKGLTTDGTRLVIGTDNELFKYLKGSNPTSQAKKK